MRHEWRGFRPSAIFNKNYPAYPVSLEELAHALDACPARDPWSVQEIAVEPHIDSGRRKTIIPYGRCIPVEQARSWQPGLHCRIVLFDHESVSVVPRQRHQRNALATGTATLVTLYTLEQYRDIILFHILFHEIGHAKSIFEQGDYSEQAADRYAMQIRQGLSTLPASIPFNFVLQHAKTLYITHDF